GGRHSTKQETAGLQLQIAARPAVRADRDVAGAGDRPSAQPAREPLEFEFRMRSRLRPFSGRVQFEIQRTRPGIEEQRWIELARAGVEFPARRSREIDVTRHRQHAGGLRELELLYVQ